MPWAEKETVLCWSAFTLALLLNVWIRGRADGFGFPAHGANVEIRPFGVLPSVWLQENANSPAPSFIGWAYTFIHISWFLLPWLPAAWLTIRREKVASFFAPILLLYALATLCFILFPVQPPWMAEPGVTRVIASTLGTDGHDSNQLAALPSMHVALPAAISLWFLLRRWLKVGLFLAVYTGLVAFEVVASGEHYVTDVIAALVVACVAVFAAAGIPRLTRVQASTSGRRFVGERGQNLVEFALMFPMLLLFIGVIIVFGLMLHTRSNLQQAVREGARQAAVGKSLTDVQNLAAGNSNSTLDPSDVQWCFPAGTGSVGDPVTVYIYRSDGEGYPYDLVPSGGTFNAVFGASVLTVRMSPRATTRLEKSVPASIVSAAKACPS